MSGHSKWSSIKHKKGAADAKRGKLFTKLVKELTIAAKIGGGDPDSNPRLRLAILKAKDGNMPADNIDRAIKKGTGELEGVTYEEITYEGYGPEGVAILVKCLTDNKNRTTSEVRNIFAKRNGNMAGAGSVAWMFEAKGLIVIKSDLIDEEKLFEIVTEAGAEDLSNEGDIYEIITETTTFEDVKKAITDAGVDIESSDLTMIPKNTTSIDVEKAKANLNLIEVLEDNDDVQNVYSNLEIPDELMEE